MKSIRNYFVNAEPWQLCLMMVAPYAVYKFTQFGHNNPYDWGVLVFYFLAVALGWIYSIGIESNEQLKEDFQLSSNIFSVAVITPFVCFAILLFFVIIPLSAGEISYPPRWAIFVNFSGIICFAYSVWFAAKQFSTVESGYQTTFIDYYPAFMSLWFGFIGVWFLQPKAQTTLGNQN